MVEAYALRTRDWLKCAAVHIIFTARNVLLVEFGHVEKEAHRHVRVEGALMFPEVQLINDDEGDIVLHA